MKTLIIFLFFFTFALKPLSSQANEWMQQWFKKENLANLLDTSNLPSDAVIEVKLDDKDIRLDNKECPAPLFTKQTNQKVWGKTLLKIHCLGADQSPFYVYAYFNVWAPVLVAKEPLQNAQTITPNQLEYRTINLIDLKQGWINQFNQLNDKKTRQPISPGTALYPGLFIDKPLLDHGDSVKVIIKGDGFHVVSMATALEEGSQGDIVKIKTSKGEILHGVAVSELTVEVSL